MLKIISNELKLASTYYMPFFGNIGIYDASLKIIFVIINVRIGNNNSNSIAKIEMEGNIHAKKNTFYLYNFKY